MTHAILPKNVLRLSSRCAGAQRIRETRIRHLLSSTCVCFMMLIVILVLFTYEDVWYRHKTQNAHDTSLLHAYTNLANAMTDEMKIRIAHNTAKEEEARQRVEAAYATYLYVRDERHDDTNRRARLQYDYAQYRSSSDDVGPLLISFVDVAMSLGGDVIESLAQHFSVSSKHAMHLVELQSVRSAFSILAGRALFVEKSHAPGTSLDALVAAAMTLDDATAHYAQHISSDLDKLASTNFFLSHVSGLVRGTSSFRTPADGRIKSPGLSGLVDMMAYLKTLAIVPHVHTREELHTVILYGVAVLLALLATLGSLWLFCFTRRQVEPTRRMLAAFESIEVHQDLRQRYLPLLLSLRGVKLPRQPQSELEREYLVAAQHVELLRSTLPQLLLGESVGVMSNAHKKRTQQRFPHCDSEAACRDPSVSEDDVEDEAETCVKVGHGRRRGASASASSCKTSMLELIRPWSCATEAARLELSTSTCTCSDTVFMEICLFENDGSFTPIRGDEKLQQQLQLLSAAYAIIVEEVNRAGGVVMGFRDGLCVPVVWNVAHAMPPRQVALVAVRTAWILRRRLAQHTSITRVLMTIVSGPAVLNNTQLGHNHYAILLGTMMAQMERLRLIARVVDDVNVFVDHETMLRLPLRTQHCCKPVLAVHSGDYNCIGTAIYSVDDAATMSVQQSSMYYAAFVLYQNNMVTEAVEEYKRYLQLYPNDNTARWLLLNIIAPLQLTAFLGDDVELDSPRNTTRERLGRAVSDCAVPSP